jgi:hypothetical protein
MNKTRVGNLVKVKNQDKKKGANADYQAVMLKQNDKIVQCLFTDVEISVAQHRALKNPEDVVQQNFISKLLD